MNLQIQKKQNLVAVSNLEVDNHFHLQQLAFQTVEVKPKNKYWINQFALGNLAIKLEDTTQEADKPTLA